MWAFVAVIVVAVGLSSLYKPKVPKPKPQEVTVPTSEEGGRVKKIYGTVWIENATILAFKKVGTDPIRKSGGKK